MMQRTYVLLDLNVRRIIVLCCLSLSNFYVIFVVEYSIHIRHEPERYQLIMCPSQCYQSMTLICNIPQGRICPALPWTVSS